MGDHTETIDVEYDPAVTDYGRLLQLFWLNHDPTACHKRQYMSAIFYHDDEQRRLAEETMKGEQERRGAKGVTKIEKADKFYNAEDYHQKYLLRQRSGLVSGLGLSDAKLITSHAAARVNGYVGGYGTRAAFNQEWRELGLSEDQAEYIRRCVGTRSPL